MPPAPSLPDDPVRDGPRHALVRGLTRMAVALLGTVAGLVGLVFAVLIVGAGATALIAMRVESAYPPTGRFVPVRGGRLAVLEAGNQDEPGREQPVTVLLLHGASATAADPMEGVGHALAARGFHVLAFDRPGYGWSDRLGVSAADPLGAQADAVAEAVERMGIGPAVVLGHSWSGALALRLALDHPAQVAGLVLAAPVALPFPERHLPWWARFALQPPVTALLVRTLAVPIGRYYLDAAAHNVFAPQTMTPGYVERSRAPLILRPGSARANIEDLAGLPAALAAQAPRYDAITKPTTIVSGDADPAVRFALQAVPLSQAIPDARLVRLPGIGHMIQYVASDALVEAVEDVARRAEAPAAR